MVSSGAGRHILLAVWHPIRRRLRDSWLPVRGWLEENLPLNMVVHIFEHPRRSRWEASAFGITGTFCCYLMSPIARWCLNQLDWFGTGASGPHWGTTGWIGWVNFACAAIGFGLGLIAVLTYFYHVAMFPAEVEDE